MEAVDGGPASQDPFSGTGTGVTADETTMILGPRSRFVERPGVVYKRLALSPGTDGREEERPIGPVQKEQQEKGQRGRWVRLIGGWLLILLGVAGLFLPLLQGIVLIVAGLALLSKDAPWAKRWMAWIRGRFRKKHDGA